MRFQFMILAMAIFCFQAGIVSAQNELPVEKIEVVKAFDARLMETKKIPVEPKLPPLDTSTTAYDYHVTARNFQVAYDAPELRPLAMPVEASGPVYRNFARAGYGAPNAILGDANLNYINDGLFEIGLDAHYRRANNKKLEDQRFSEIRGELSGKYYVSDFLAAGGSVNYSRDEYYMYGYDHEVTVGPELRNDSRLFNTFGMKANFFNPERTGGGFDYRGEIAFQKRKDAIELSETNFGISLGATKWIAEKHPLSIDVRGEFTQLKSLVLNEEKSNLNNFFVKPNFVFGKNRLRVNAGISFGFSMDQVHYLPDLEVSYQFMSGRLIPYISWEGNLQKNHFSRISAYNPFALFTPGQLLNEEWQHYFGGVRGSYRGIAYDISAGYKTFRNLALYEQNIVDERRFNVVYDDGNAVVLSASVEAPINAHFKAGLTAYKNFYSLDTYERAWHLPGMEFNLFAQYRGLKDKLVVRPELNIMDGVPIRNINDERDRLGSLLDVSIQADYFILENIGVFLHLNNMTSNKRERWQQYPTYGFNVIGGASVRF